MMIIKDKNKLISFMVVAFIVVAWMEKGNSHHSFFYRKHPFQGQVNQQDLVEQLAHGLIFVISNRFPYANLLKGNALFSGHRSLLVDFDISFAATARNCEHNANTDCDHEAD